MIRKLSLLTILAIAATATPVGAAVVSVWNFDGVCSDCPGNGTGLLTVSQVGNGPLSFEFTYSSAWIAYTMDNASVFINNVAFSGTTFTMPTTGNFRLQQEVPMTSFGGVGNPLAPGVYNDGMVNFFNRYSDGFWSTGSNAFVNDFGTGFTFVQGSANTGVPEPSSLALLAAGAAACLLRRRKQ